MHSRTHSIHRALVLRLLIVAGCVSLIAGTLVYFNERSRIAELIADRSSVGVEAIRSEMRYLLKPGDPPQPATVQKALEIVAAKMPRSRIGEYVFIVIHEARSGKPWAKLSVDESTGRGIQMTVEAIAPEQLRFPEHDVSIERGPKGSAYVALPVFAESGELVAHINGVFALSKAAISDLNWRITRAVGFAIGIVLVTTALLYPTIITLFRRLSQLSIQLLDSNLSTIQVLGSAIAKRDSDTDAHNYRVTVYAVRIAEALSLKTTAIRALIKGAFLHDVGKIGITDNILLKPARLDEDEFEEMKKHVAHGLDIVRSAKWLEDAADVVGSHHEKIDGSGYQVGKRGEEIPITARIFAIADVFDALTSARPYKQALGFEQTMNILNEGAGSHFDPDVLETFASLAPSLYREFANQDEAARLALDDIVEQYFKEDIGDLMA